MANQKHTLQCEMFVRSFSTHSKLRQSIPPDTLRRQIRPKGRRLPKESGVTLLMVAVGMFSLLAMLVLSLDVINLYLSSDQAQKAADAAALAGAEALANSGTTSVPSLVPLTSVCNGSTGDADLRVQAVAGQNTIAGSAPTTVTDLCPTPTYGENPQIQVSVTRTGLPTFFARIWSSATHSVSAAATAEAYNPSYDVTNPPPSTRPAIAIHGVKPWLVFNCNTCGSPAYFTSTYALVSGILGTSVTLTLMGYTTIPSTPTQFYALDGPAPVSCPSTSAVSCGQIGTGPPGLNYHDNIACENGFNFTNGQLVGTGEAFWVDTRSVGSIHARTIPGTTCLIHAGTSGLGQGQDSFTIGVPAIITGGDNNPNTSLKRVNGIHRSDSVVTVPVFNCPAGGPCDGTGTVPLPIVGLLQLGIQDVTATGDIDAVILNAAGLDPTSGVPPVMGQGTSPVPVRLIHP